MAPRRALLATALAALLTLAGLASGRAHEGAMPAGSDPLPERPERVVSMNLCTDQLAMLLAAPGQLLSVSRLAAEPRGSSMAEEAGKYRLNHGRAEEIWLMQPDLVLAGSFSNSATVDMLRRLGVPVVVMDPAYSLADVPARLRETGRALGREAAAERSVARFRNRLSELRAEVEDRPRAALYQANGYTTGDNTLAGEIIATAGFANIAGEAGVPAGGHLPLEVLAMTAPEAVITGQPYPGASRSEEILDHPVVDALRSDAIGAVLTDRDWVCGTPHVLRAIEKMRETRRRIGSE